MYGRYLSRPFLEYGRWFGKDGKKSHCTLFVTYRLRILQEGRITKDSSTCGLKKSSKTMVEASITVKIREFGYV